MVPLHVQMIHTDVTVGTHDSGGRVYITAEAQCIKWVKKIHPLLTQVAKVNLAVQFSKAMNLANDFALFAICLSCI